MAGALDGMTVLDLSILIQGPQAAAMLHDLGADVIKVELPESGDLGRWIPVSADDPRSPLFEACNRGKRSVTLDLRQPGGRTALLRLVETADVLIHNFVPGTMDRWGLSYDSLAELNPSLIHASGSSFGPLGPDAEREGADMVGQAYGGIISATGSDGGELSPVGALVADHCGSQNLCNGILAALFARERTGRGQRVDASLGRLSRFTVREMVGGSHHAISSRTSVVESEISVVAPPITPARLMISSRSSVITPSLATSVRSTSSSVTSVSPSRARRTRRWPLGTVARSNVWLGWPSSSIT